METVTPKTYLIGCTEINHEGLEQYLRDTGNILFLDDLDSAFSRGLKGGVALCSFYAKLCYRSLTTGQNLNVSKTRAIEENIKACFQQGHGSVFEHCWLNFVTTNCSRVFTHELVRHRVGTAFSQTSGRYVRSEQLDMVLDDPILDTPLLSGGHCVRGWLQDIACDVEQSYNALMQQIDWAGMDFDKKKKLTSALRRILPNGQANEIGWSCNVRALRHLIEMRTNRHAEWEIRKVFNDVFQIVLKEFPLALYGYVPEEVDGLWEITGLK